MITAPSASQSAKHTPVVPQKILGQLAADWLREKPSRQELGHSSFQVNVVGNAGFVKIDLREHEISGEDKSFGAVPPAFGHTQAGRDGIAFWSTLHCGDDRRQQAVKIETSILHTCM